MAPDLECGATVRQLDGYANSYFGAAIVVITVPGLVFVCLGIHKTITISDRLSAFNYITNAGENFSWITVFRAIVFRSLH